MFGCDPPGDHPDNSRGATAVWVCRRNIAHFVSLLAGENCIDRALLTKLLAEEEDRLRRLLKRENEE